MSMISIGDTELHCDWRPGHGPTLVLIHEMGGRLEGWQEVLDGLPPGQAVLRHDLRGCGGSAAGEQAPSVERHVADLHALLAALGIASPLVLVGTAVGGAVALAFAATWPERVEQVIALAPACGVKPERAAATRQLADNIRKLGMEQAFLPLAQIGWPASCRRDDGRYARYVENVLTTDPAGPAATLDMLADMDLDPVLRRVTAPTLLVGGRHDGLRPAEEIARLAALIGPSETLFIDSGHFVHVERPDLVIPLIGQHLVCGVSA